MTPEGKAVAALADIFLKGLNDRIDKAEADCKHYRERLDELAADHAKLREALERIRPFVDLDYKTHEGVRVGEIIDAALSSKGAERE